MRYLVLVDFDYSPEGEPASVRAVKGSELTSEDVSDKRAAEMAALEVLAEVTP